MNNFISLIKQSKIKKVDWVLLSLCFSFLSVVGFYLPVMLHRLYLATEEGEYFHILWVLLILYLLQYVFRVFYQIHVAHLSRRAIKTLREDVFYKWIFDRSSWSGSSRVDRYSIGEIQARLLSDTNAIKEAVDTGSMTIIFDFILVFSCLVSFLFIDLKIGIIFFIVQAAAVAGLIYTSKKLGPVFHFVRRMYSDLTKELTDLLKGLHQIFGIKQDHYALNRLKGVQELYLQSQLKANFYDASYFAFAESLFPLFLAFLVLVAPMTIGKNLALLAVIVDLIQRSVGPMKDLANKISNLQRVFTGIERVTEFENDLRPITFNSTFNADSEEIQKVFFQISDFAYPENVKAPQQRSNFNLSSLSFELHRGESLGIAGRSGAGKSTLLKILALQLYAPNTKVTFFNKNFQKDIKFSDENDLRYFAQRVCIVSQESHLFSTTLFYNITLSHELDQSFEEFWQKMKSQISYLAIWKIAPTDRINPNELSFGQRQLLGALRAVYLKRPIIIFDEISAGMDKFLEESLYSLLQLMTKDCLTIVVAHRLETIKRCNNILLMDHGKIIANGTHSQLMQTSLEYADYIKEAQES